MAFHATYCGMPQQQSPKLPRPTMELCFGGEKKNQHLFQESIHETHTGRGLLSRDQVCLGESLRERSGVPHFVLWCEASYVQSFSDSLPYIYLLFILRRSPIVQGWLRKAVSSLAFWPCIAILSFIQCRDGIQGFTHARQELKPRHPLQTRGERALRASFL